MNDWNKLSVSQPPLGVLVLTKIHDDRSERNIQRMQRGGENGRLWFTEDGLYVYYSPTHWRYLE